ncbi:MAG: ribosome maturation factor RimM [Solirubrobacterales bacterium]
MGRVGRPHGTDGGFTVTDPTERIELLEPGRSLVVGGREMTVAARRGTAEHPIVVLEGAHDRAGAEALRGEVIAVPRAALGALAEGEFLVDDLVGCEVVDGERPVGRVQDVLLLPSADTLEVERPGEDPLLVPLVGDAVRSVDTADRRIDVDMRFLADSA